MSNTTNTFALNDTLTNIKAVETYSSDEIDTGKIWFNGEHIYRKYYTGTCSGNSNYTANVVIENSNFIPVTVHGYTLLSSNGCYCNCSLLEIMAEGQQLVLYNKVSSASITYYLMIEYIKM